MPIDYGAFDRLEHYLDAKKVELILLQFERRGGRGFTKKTASGEWQLDGV